MVLLDYSNKLARFSNLRVVGGFNTHTLNSCDNDDDDDNDDDNDDDKSSN